MIDFTKSHGMMWPQHYDGRGWENELAVKYKVQVIPAMFLLDQNGMIVSTGIRRDTLSQEIARLLKRRSF